MRAPAQQLTCSARRNPAATPGWERQTDVPCLVLHRKGQHAATPVRVVKAKRGLQSTGSEREWMMQQRAGEEPSPQQRVPFLEVALSAEGKSGLLKTGRGVKRWKEGNRKGKPKNQAMKQKYGKREEKQFAHLAALCVGRKETDRVRASTCSL